MPAPQPSRPPYPEAAPLVSHVVLQLGDTLLAVPLDDLGDDDGPLIVGIVMGGTTCLIEGVEGAVRFGTEDVGGAPLLAV